MTETTTPMPSFETTDLDPTGTADTPFESSDASEDISQEPETLEGSSGGEPAEAATAPDSYDLQAPEGFALDPQAIAAATPVFRELGLSNEQANKLMPVAAQFAAGLTDKLNAQILGQVRSERKAWLDAAMADREIGGAQWKQTLAKGAYALESLGFPKGSAFRVLLDESGLGNHPEMIRAWAKVGRAIGEDSDFVRGGAATASRRDTAETLYPDDGPRG